MESMPPASGIQWISTADQLPDDGLAVLVALDDGEVWTGYVDGVSWRFVSADPIEGTVTHWADFPPPPSAA